MKVLLNIIFAYICAWLIFSPVTAYADDSSDQEASESPQPIDAGTPAPFTGILFSTVDAANLLANMEQAETVCQARIDLAVSTALSPKQLQLDNCNSSLQIRTELYETQIQSYRDYSQFLEERIHKPKIPQEVTFILGIVAGVGITIGAGYALNQVAGP